MSIEKDRVYGSYPGVAIVRRSFWDFSRPFRSWVGGAPLLGPDTEWPGGTDPSYNLQFHAQICCEDLPEEIWHGTGPRTGWLTFFTSKVIHTPNLGNPLSPSAPFNDLFVSNYSQLRHRSRKSDPNALLRKTPIDLVRFQDQEALKAIRLGALKTKPFGLPSITDRPDLLQCAFDAVVDAPDDIEAIREKFAKLSSEEFIRWFDHWKQPNVIGIMGGEPSWVQESSFHYEDDDFQFLEEYMNKRRGIEIPEKVINPYLMMQLGGDAVSGSGDDPTGGQVYFGLPREDMAKSEFLDVIFDYQNT